MQQLKSIRLARLQGRQRGITLLESLVAIVVTAVGILGIAGVQMRTLVDSQNSVRREQAIRLIENLDERLKGNPNALTQLPSYVSGWSATAPSCPPPAPAPSCSAGACNPAQLAAFDLADWKQTVRCALPVGNANVFLAPGDDPNNPRQLGVMISWRQNEASSADAAYLTSIDASGANSGSGGGGTIACPANSTCHLQYISVSARCAPYFAGNDATPRFYCSGP